jgi:uncharacterized membrane protein YgcG
LSDCLYNAPVPYLPLVAAPVQRLSEISLAMQFAIANSQTVCSQPLQGVSAGEKLVSIGRENPGTRFMLGVTSIADADRYRLDMASLETQTSPTAAAKFTNSTGRTFVKPSAASMRAAVALAKPDNTSGIWPINLTRLRTVPAGADAYPGTMIVYTAVPTKGLPKGLASDYAKLLHFAATAGQKPGFGNGDLPPGYLPMTTANGLGSLANYTLRAADAVKAQAGVLPSLKAPKSSASKGSQGSSSSGSGSGSSSSSSGGGGTTPSSGSSTTKSPTKGSTPKVAGSAAAVSPGVTAAASSSVAGAALPALLGLALLSGLLAPVITRLRRRRASS